MNRKLDDIYLRYEKLGELVYRDLHTEDDLEAEKLSVIAAIDGLFDQLTELQGRCTVETTGKETSGTQTSEEETSKEETPKEKATEDSEPTAE